MTDDDIVARLRAMSNHPYNQHGPHDTLSFAADAIERLTRERDDAHQRYVDANEARIDAEKSLTDAYMAGAADARKERDSARVTMSEALRQADAAIARAEAAERERDEARAGNHSANDYEPTWAELTDYWKRRAEAAERKAEKLREAITYLVEDHEYMAGTRNIVTKRARAALKETESE